MGRHFRVSVVKHDPPQPAMDPTRSKSGDLLSPFGKIDGLSREDFRETAYEVFFAACRSSPGFGGGGSGRNASVSPYNSSDGGGDVPGSPAKTHGVGMAVTSRVKAALGLKIARRSISSRSLSSRSLRRVSSCGMNNSPSSPTSSPKVGTTVPPGGRLRRPMTSAEIMRLQMRVTEQSDNRLRKTLTRTLVGQMGRRTETIILPLELLRHLKPSEFNDAHEYHLWQKRHLKILEAGLLLHPSAPLEKSNPQAAKLREIIRASEAKALDTGRNSRTMKTLSDCVVSLARRGPDSGTTDVCHWADGYPLNVHVYNSLLRTVFDMKDETMVLDEVDELLELMKKTWSTLGFDRAMHNLCFAWVLFEQFVATGQVEPDLLGASFMMLKEVENDAKRVDRDPVYIKMLASVLGVIRKWSGERLLDYHANFSRATVGLMESMLPLLFSSTKMLEEDVPFYVASKHGTGDANEKFTGNKVDHCVQSSLRNAFSKMVEEQNGKGAKNSETQLTSETMVTLAIKTEELAAKERDVFSPVLKKWSRAVAGIASTTLHACYGIRLRQYLVSKSWQMNEMLLVLQTAGKLEKALVEMAVVESIDCEDGGKGIVKQMVPYDVESMVSRMLKQWIQDRLRKGQEHLLRTKQTETWNPRSKNEPYAHSAMELVAFAKDAVESFYQLTVNVPESTFYDFVDGLESAFLDYIAFVSSCGSKQNYLPTIPPLTRCSRDSKLFKLWKRAACGVAVEDYKWDLAFNENSHIRASTSRGTQRLYIRINSLHYLALQIPSIEKALTAPSNVAPPKTSLGHQRSQSTCSYFEQTLSALQVASQHASEVAACRLIFSDSNSVFHGGLYIPSVVRARIQPAVHSLRHNLRLLCTIVIERAQPLVLKEVMRASFEAFLRVLITGGSSRTYSRTDHPMIEEDLDSLKRVFCMCGEGLIVEDMVERETEAAQGVVVLMGQSTEQLIEDFIGVTIGSHGNIFNQKQKIPIPPTTGNWSRTDPNTILRVLCSRNDGTGNEFLKKTLHLAKRRGGIRIM